MSNLTESQILFLSSYYSKRYELYHVSADIYDAISEIWRKKLYKQSIL